jgi:hypothetical protein
MVFDRNEITAMPTSIDDFGETTTVTATLNGFLSKLTVLGIGRNRMESFYLPNQQLTTFSRLLELDYVPDNMLITTQHSTRGIPVHLRKFTSIPLPLSHVINVVDTTVSLFDCQKTATSLSTSTGFLAKLAIVGIGECRIRRNSLPAL